jgi:hypothetical protein
MMNYTNANRILKMCSTEYKVNELDIMSDSRKGKIIFAKHILRNLLLNSNFTSKEVIKFCNINRATLYHSIEVVNALSETDLDEYARYERLKRLILSIDKIKDDTLAEKLDFKVFLTGKIDGLDSGYVEYKFLKHQQQLEQRFKSVVNPYALCTQKGLNTFPACMQYLIPILMECDLMFVQNDYSQSRGALHAIDIFSNILKKSVFLIR